MKKEEFLLKFIDAIEIEDEVRLDTELSELEEWDSLAAVTTLALFKKDLELNISSTDIIKCKTVGDIINLGKEKYE